MPRPTERTQAVIRNAVLPYSMARAVVPILKQTPEYEQARRERRSREWLERESMSLGYLLAETVAARLEDLDK
jgi:hypothetical protein